MPFDAVLWDVDGTLADSEPLHELSFHLAAREVGLDLPNGFHDRILGQSDAETHTMMCRDLGLDLSLLDWVALRYQIYLSHIERVTFMPGAQALWQSIERASILQATVSNSDRQLVMANLNQLGMIRPGQVSVTRNDVMHGKPDAEPYLRGAALLGVDPARTAVIEDSETGMRSGLAAGMTVFLVPGPNGETLPQARPLADLVALMS